MSNKTDPAHLDSLQGGIAHNEQVDILDAVKRRPKDLDKWFKATYDSQAEANWADAANLILYDELGEKIIFSGFEWLSFNIPGGRYTPDFFHIAESGHFIIVEVKGSRNQGSYRDSRARMRVAASLNPWAMFLMALQLPRGGGWKIEIIESKANLVAEMTRLGIKAFYNLGGQNSDG